MKHPDDNLKQLLDAQLLELGVRDRITEQQRESMIQYLLAVLRANERVNVTAVTDPPEAVRLHVVDSLSALPEIDQAAEGTLVDIGSGGGFPGVPLAIATGRPAVLLDSVARKGQAVLCALEDSSLGRLPIAIEAQRAEEYALARPASATVVVARAVAPLPSLAELAAPLLGHAGVLVALKGRLDEAEIEAGDAAAAIVGLARQSIRRFRLPVGAEERAVVSYVRVAESSIELPRRIGRAQKRPLA